MTLHLGLPYAHHRNAEQQQEMREARRMLKERVRDDWDYPPLPAFQSATTLPRRESRAAGGFRFHPSSNHDRDSGLALGLDFEPTGWRERDYSSEEDGEEAEVEVKQSKRSLEKLRKTSITSSGEAHSHHSKLGSVFKFEGPESVGQEIEERKAAKRRKRHQALTEETAWNDGLAHWLARRDAWCCARAPASLQVLEKNDSATSVDATASSAGAFSDSSSKASPRNSTSTASSSITHSAPASSPSTSSDIAPTSPPSTKATSSDKTPVTSALPPAPPSASLSDTLLPLAPTLLPNHPIRKRITPDLYPEIYSKIIISGRTPSVPINLLTLTRALVQGWKDDGEWPPKPGPVEKSIGRRRDGTKEGESSLGRGVRAVGRVLRITGIGGEKEKG